MEQIDLSANHRRSVSASIYIVEKLINEIESNILNTGTSVMSIMDKDIPDQKVKSILAAIPEIKKHIAHLQKKYRLTNESYSQHSFIQSRKTKIWVVLSDTISRKLKGYGIFPQEYASEFDQDIETLQSLIDRL